METICLIIPPHAGRSLGEYPLGVGYIANQAVKAGFTPEIMDINAQGFSKPEVEEKIKHAKADVFGISAFSTQYGYVRWLAETIKSVRKEALIIAGGPLATHQFRMVLAKTLIDCCIVGEGDQTIIDLLTHRNNFQAIKGIAFRQGDGIVVTEKQEPYPLDRLEFHPYHLFPRDIYRKKMNKTINIIVSRGCPYRCHFCSLTMTGVRVRPIQQIEAELKKLKREEGIEGVHFSDELAVTNSNRGYELCDMFKRLGLWWNGQVRVNLVDYNLLKYMKKSGCIGVSTGIESGSQTILDNMNKRNSVSQNLEFIRNCHKLNMYVWVQFMFGYTGENEQTVDESIRFFEKAQYAPPHPDAVGDSPMTSLVTPLPGSALYESCVAKGLIKDEERYTLKLERGYYIHRAEDLIFNLTDFSDGELIRKKNAFEETLWNNYRQMRNHPFRRLEHAFRGMEREMFKYKINYETEGRRKSFFVLIRDMAKRALHESRFFPQRNCVPVRPC